MSASFIFHLNCCFLTCSIHEFNFPNFSLYYSISIGLSGLSTLLIRSISLMACLATQYSLPCYFLLVSILVTYDSCLPSFMCIKSSPIYLQFVISLSLSMCTYLLLFPIALTNTHRLHRNTIFHIY